MNRNRRQFVGCVASATGAVALTGASGCAQGGADASAGASSPSSSTPVTSSSPVGTAAEASSVSTRSKLITPQDIEYLGHYEVALPGMTCVYDRGLAVRRVNGELRFLLHAFEPENTGPIKEFSITGRRFGERITTMTRQWSTAGLRIGMGEHPHEYIWWDETGQRLWVTAALDYPGFDTPSPTNINVMTLGASSIENLKRVSLQGVPDRRARGPVMDIPGPAQARHGYGPYAIGFGGYTSRMAVGGECAMGLSVFSMPDPGAYKNGDQIPSGRLKTLATRGTTAPGRRIWYGYDWSTLSGKGPISYMDGGDPRGENPPFPPTTPPIASQLRWRSPTPEGNAYWPGMGSSYCGGAYIEGPEKRGVIVVGSFLTGRVYYMSSAVYSDGATAEIHVFDPDELGQIAAGSRRPDNVEPVHMKACPETDIPTQGTSHFAAYDAVDKRLYILHGDTSNISRSKLHVYQVRA